MSDTAKEYRAAKGSVLRAPEALWNSWQHQIDPGVDWTEATRRDYWANLVERFRSGDVVEIHSFDHRYRFQHADPRCQHGGRSDLFRYFVSADLSGRPAFARGASAAGAALCDAAGARC